MLDPSVKLTRIFLVGSMGAGKTTIGRHLAKSLGYEFVDSDHEIEARTGASIPLIFDVEGEAGFRKREAAMIDELSQRDQIVLATGGGAVLNEQSRRKLRTRGMVIYLYASAEQLFERTSRDRSRPLLQTDNPQQKIEEILQVRDPLYKDVADIVLETGSGSVRSVVQKILTQLNELGVGNK